MPAVTYRYFALTRSMVFFRHGIFRLITAWIYRARVQLLLRCLLLCGMWSAVLPSVGSAALEMPSAVTTPETNQKLAQMVLGIISYTQWSQSNEQVHVCVIDSPYYYKVLLPLQADPKQSIRIWLKTAKTPDLTQQCHVLFFENTPAAQQQEIINQRGIRRILSLSMNNAPCVTGSSFCLSVTQGIPSFSLNFDSLKQSGAKVSSKVLMLAKPSPSQD